MWIKYLPSKCKRVPEFEFPEATESKHGNTPLVRWETNRRIPEAQRLAGLEYISVNKRYLNCLKTS